MKIAEIRKKFSEGEVDKANYIKLMYEEIHSKIFDYAEFLQFTDISKIEIQSDLVIFEERKYGIKMICLENDRRLPPIEAINFLQYEPSDSSMMLRLMPESGTVLDVGANSGWYSLLYARYNSDLDIYSYEPIPKTFELLQRNIELNELNNIKIFNYGLSNVNDRITFYYYKEVSGNASARKMTKEYENDLIECDVKKLDDICETFEKPIEFIKCDVEGAEYLVIEGALGVISNDKPIIFLEMLRKWAEKYGYHPNEIIDLMEEKEYSCFTVDGDKLKEFRRMDAKTIETNYFFLHRKKHRSLVEKFS